MPKITEPVKTVKSNSHHADETESSHPAFAQVSLSRVTGSAKLYGSALDTVQEFVTLTVNKSTEMHSLGRNWYSSRQRPLIEIHMSAAQFAEMLTGFGRQGVPCTLDCLDGKDIPGIPWEHETESKKVVDAFKKNTQAAVEELRKASKDAAELLAKPTLNKADRRALQWILDKAVQNCESNAPFMVTQFEEAAERVVTAAKSEVEAFTTRVVREAGVQAIREQSQQKALKGSDDV